MKVNQLKEAIGVKLIIAYIILISACFLSFSLNGISELQIAIILFSFSPIAPTAIKMFSYIVNGSKESIIVIEKKELEAIGKKILQHKFRGDKSLISDLLKDYYTSIIAFTTYNAEELLDKTQINLITAVALGHPLMALIILGLKSFNLILWDDTTLLTVCSFGSIIFGVFWSSIFQKLFNE